MADDRISGYAAGLYEIARAEGVLERLDSELSLVAQAFETSDELRSVLTDARIPDERRHAVISDLLGSRADDLTVAVAQFLVSTGRIGELSEISAAVSRHAASAAGKELAVVRSAIALDDATIDRLRAALGKATGKQVDIRVVVDPAVLGGIVATVGDTVIDGSVRSRLAQLRAAVGTR